MTEPRDRGRWILLLVALAAFAAVLAMWWHAGGADFGRG
jgi:hypothetical protein